MIRLVTLDEHTAALLSRKVGQSASKAKVRAASEVTPLSNDTADWVFIIPVHLLRSSEWPQTRIRLSQANRYWLAYGTDMDTQTIVQACRDGAFDVLAMADNPNRWSAAWTEAAQAQHTWLTLYGGAPMDRDAILIGASDSTLALRRSIDRLGPTIASVLLLGASGVGKEKVAQALHESANKGAFVAINCAALPADLLESELFGVTKGAFTGATADRPGLVEQASGGTLFLDEIGEMELNLQAKLLRFLETKKARRLGSNQEYSVSPRIISATNRDLDTEIAAGKFRADLYYRLAEIVLRIPPLNQRPEDIPLLARHFLALACERFGKYFETIEPALIRVWQHEAWQGNIRELKSTIDRLVLLHDGPVMRKGWWSPSSPAPQPPPPSPPPSSSSTSPRAYQLPSKQQRFALAKQLLAEPNHDLTWIAAQVGVHPSTLYRWRKHKQV